MPHFDVRSACVEVVEDLLRMDQEDQLPAILRVRRADLVSTAAVVGGTFIEYSCMKTRAQESI
jgi:hypothetical protein